MSLDHVKAFEMARQSKDEVDGTEGDEVDIDGYIIEINELDNPEEDSESNNH
jgi:hypothetical protein